MLDIIPYPLWNRNPMVRKTKEVEVCPWCVTEVVFYRYGKQRCPECFRPIVVSPDNPSTELSERERLQSGIEIGYSSIQRPTVNDERLKNALLSQISFLEGIVRELIQMSGDIELCGLGVENEIEKLRRRIEQLRGLIQIKDERKSK